MILYNNKLHNAFHCCNSHIQSICVVFEAIVTTYFYVPNAHEGPLQVSRVRKRTRAGVRVQQISKSLRCMSQSAGAYMTRRTHIYTYIGSATLSMMLKNIRLTNCLHHVVLRWFPTKIYLSERNSFTLSFLWNFFGHFSKRCSCNVVYNIVCWSNRMDDASLHTMG